MQSEAAAQIDVQRTNRTENMNVKEQLMESWWLIAVSISVSVIAQTVIKLGVSETASTINLPFNLPGPLAMIVQSPLVLVGLGLYGIGAFTWIMVLSRLDLSLAYPFLALNFVLITLISRVFLGESVPPLRWVGIGVICMGILLVARSNMTN